LKRASHKKFPIQRAALCALALFLTQAIPSSQAAAPPAGQPTAEQAASFAAMDENSRTRLLMQLAMTGQHELAATLLTQYPLTGPHSKNRVLFLEGLIKKGRGDLTGAAKNYRAALAADPSLTLVRAELAKTLAALDEDDSAKHHLDILAQSAPSEDAAKGIRSFIDQIDQKQPLKYSAFISMAPTSNINGGANHSTMTVFDPFTGHSMPAQITKRKSGVGASVGASVGYSRRVGNDFYFVSAANAYGALYQDSDANSYGLSESAELRYMMDKGFLGLGLVSSQSMALYDVSATDSAFEHIISYGPRISTQYNIALHDRANVSASYLWKNSLEKDVHDGTSLAVDASLEHTFDPSLNVSLFAGFDRVTATYDYQSYDSWSGGLGFYKELPNGITVNAKGTLQTSQFVGDFPLLGAPRHDKRLSTTLDLTKRDLNFFGFAPSVEYTYVRNRSNVDIYDYDTHTVDFRLTKDF
jgi:hypothetical protein